MGVIVELARAKQRIKELEAEVAKLEAGGLEFYETHKPVSTQQISFSDLYGLLQAYFPKAVINLGENYRFLCHYDVRALVAGIGFCAAYQYANNLSPIDLALAFLGGAGVDAVGNRISGSIKAGLGK